MTPKQYEDEILKYLRRRDNHSCRGFMDIALCVINNPIKQGMKQRDGARVVEADEFFKMFSEEVSQ